MDKISVIMPAYNSEKYIRESIDSVIHQTYQNWEFIIVNDGSRDSTREIILEYVHRYPGKVIIIDKPQNEGISKGLNAAIDRAEGPYIIWLSSDDVYVPDMLQSELAYLTSHPEYDIVFSDYDFIDPQSNYLSESLKPYAIHELIRGDGREPYRFLLNLFCINGCSVLCKKEHYLHTGGFKHEYKYAHDYEMWVRFAINYKIGYLDKINVHYRKHPDQGTNLGMNEIDAIQALFALMKTDRFDQLLKKADYPLGFEGRLKVMDNIMIHFKHKEREMDTLYQEAMKYYEESDQYGDDVKCMELHRKLIRKLDLIQHNAEIAVADFFQPKVQDNWLELLCEREQLDGFLINNDGARFERFTGNDLQRLRKGIKYNNAIVKCKFSKKQLKQVIDEFGEGMKYLLPSDDKQEYMIGLSEFMLMNEGYSRIFEGKEYYMTDKDIWNTVTDALLDKELFYQIGSYH